ncbi:hypothetical protein GW17_00041819 [Ensete ventricosum]|nr:hypothetical protein GW17_00041819 [Ensete ventricosum]
MFRLLAREKKRLQARAATACGQGHRVILSCKDCHIDPYQRTELSSVRYGTRYRAVCTGHTTQRNRPPAKKSPVGDSSPTGEEDSSYFSPSSSSPSSSFSLPQLIPPEIGRRRSKLTVIAKQQPTTFENNRYQSISRGNGRKQRSVYRLAGGPVRTPGTDDTARKSARERGWRRRAGVDVAWKLPLELLCILRHATRYPEKLQRQKLLVQVLCSPKLNVRLSEDAQAIILHHGQNIRAIQKGRRRHQRSHSSGGGSNICSTETVRIGIPNARIDYRRVWKLHLVE